MLNKHVDVDWWISLHILVYRLFVGGGTQKPGKYFILYLFISGYISVRRAPPPQETVCIWRGSHRTSLRTISLHSYLAIPPPSYGPISTTTPNESATGAHTYRCVPAMKLSAVQLSATRSSLLIGKYTTFPTSPSPLGLRYSNPTNHRVPRHLLLLQSPIPHNTTPPPSHQTGVSLV